jgi:ribosome-associated protein
MKCDPLVMLNTIAQAIFDKKGMNILALDVRGVSSITDYVVIAEGTVDRHVKAIAQAIESALKEVGESPSSVEGRREGDWVVLDYLLEELWKKGEIVDLKIDITQ